MDALGIGGGARRRLAPNDLSVDQGMPPRAGTGRRGQAKLLRDGTGKGGGARAAALDGTEASDSHTSESASLLADIVCSSRCACAGQEIAARTGLCEI